MAMELFPNSMMRRCGGGREGVEWSAWSKMTNEDGEDWIAFYVQW